MADVGFYHCTRTKPGAALPALLGRTLEAGERAVVLCAVASIPALDEALWAVPSWLPHGSAAEGDAELQPIWLTAREESPNGAGFLFLLDGTAWTGTWARVFDLFDGDDADAVEAARARWREAGAAGHARSYFQQTERGWTRRDTV